MLRACGAALSRRRPHRSAFSRASESADGERSTASVCMGRKLRRGEDDWPDWRPYVRPSARQPDPVPMSSTRNGSLSTSAEFVASSEGDENAEDVRRRSVRVASQASVSGRGMRVGGRTTRSTGRGWNGCVPARESFSQSKHLTVAWKRHRVRRPAVCRARQCRKPCLRANAPIPNCRPLLEQPSRAIAALVEPVLRVWQSRAGRKRVCSTP